MNLKVCKSLIKSYTDWLASKTSFADMEGIYEITTPFLDRHNDKLQIYLSENDGLFRLTDDGYIIADLISSGCAINTDSRKRYLEMILQGFGIHTNQDSELYVHTTASDFPKKKHKLIQAILAVNDMFALSKHRVANLFIEDVGKYLDENDIRYSPAVDFVGKTGLSHKFDYVIPKSSKQPERLIRAINKPSRDSATTLLFAWTDTKDVRPANAKAFAIINDEDSDSVGTFINYLTPYGVTPIRWSERERFTNELSA